MEESAVCAGSGTLQLRSFCCICHQDNWQRTDRRVMEFLRMPTLSSSALDDSFGMRSGLGGLARDTIGAVDGVAWANESDDDTGEHDRGDKFE